MLNKILESLYLKVFINIIVRRSGTTIDVEVYSKSNDISRYENVFSSTTLSEEIYSYIMGFIKESPYYYISILDTSNEQGAIPTCEKNRLSYYQDLSASEYKCIDKKWSIYTSKTDLYELEKRYEDIGIDFIFSPFIVLAKFFKDKVDKTLAMYALVQEGSISVAVFENSQLLFAQHLDMEIEPIEENIDLEELDEDKEVDLELDDEAIVLDEMDVDDELEDFSDIEDLDTLEDIDEFSEGKDLEEELYENEAQADETQAEKKEDSQFNEDYQRFSLIQNSIKNFYKDPKYESKFIENIYIADSTQVSADLKRYLEEEMFLNVYVRSIDLGLEVCELAKEELGI